MSSSLITDLLGILDELSGGVHTGFRPAHAKGSSFLAAGFFLGIKPFWSSHLSAQAKGQSPFL